VKKLIDKMSIENKIIEDMSENTKLILNSVKVLSQNLLQLKKDVRSCENYMDSLNNIINDAEKGIASINECVYAMQKVGKQIIYTSLETLPIEENSFKSVKIEADKILQDLDTINVENDEYFIDAKLTSSQKNISSKCLDEKYPEHCSRESLLDGVNLITLPTVKEDVFADFNRPNRTLSSSSLKSIRKVKRCLQK